MCVCMYDHGDMHRLNKKLINFSINILRISPYFWSNFQGLIDATKINQQLKTVPKIETKTYRKF